MKHTRINTTATEAFYSTEVIGAIGLRQWHFNGIRILCFEGSAGENSLADWSGEEEEITMCFNLLGNSTLRSGHAPTGQVTFSDKQHNTLYSHTAKTKLVFGKSDMKLMLIRLSRKAFFEISGTEHRALQEFHESMSQNVPVALFSRNQEISFLMHTCIDAMLHCNYEDSLKKIFLFSKVAELIVLQLESLKPENTLKNPYLKTEYDKERILYAREYLLKNMANPPSLKQLARVSGINEFKLKKGFKELFQQTAYEYLSDVRLEIAKNDLLEHKKTVSQIAFELGYSSLQHFSNAFKRKYGLSPSQVK